MASLSETFVTKSYVKGKKMDYGRNKQKKMPDRRKPTMGRKPKNSKISVVSPSRRGEGSRPKPVAKRVSPSKRGEGSTNLKATLAMKKKQAKVQEAGVANVAGTIAKGAIALAKNINKTKTKPTQIKTTPKSNVTRIFKNEKELKESKYRQRYEALMRQIEKERSSRGKR